VPPDAYSGLIPHAKNTAHPSKGEELEFHNSSLVKINVWKNVNVNAKFKCERI